MKASTKSHRLLAAASAVTLAALAVAGAAAHEPKTPTAISAGSRALQEAMEKGHKDMMAMKMTGDADHDFAMMMVSHHKGAIDMSEAVLKHGRDAKIQGMARQIIDAQKKEIAEFEAWMKQHRPAMEHKH